MSTDARCAPSGKLSELEKMGALLGRLVHDLSNEATCAVTTLSLTQEPNAADWQEISLSMDRISGCLRKFNEILQSVRPTINGVSSENLLPPLQEVCAQFPNWTFQNELKKPLIVQGEPHWLAESVREILEEIKKLGVESGQVRASAGTSSEWTKAFSEAKPLPARTNLVIEISFDASGRELPAQLISAQQDHAWLISMELIRQMRGWLSLRTEGKKQRLVLCLAGA